jgi:tetratricopeptide (TPR) repeat protein
MTLAKPRCRLAAATALVLAIGCSRDSSSNPASATAAIPRPDLAFVAEAPLKAALLAAQQAVEKSPASVAAWSDYGMLLASHDWRNEGAAAFAAAERLDPKNFRWPYLQGVQLAPVDVPRALAAFERALALDDRYAPAHVNRGRLLIERERLDEARGEFEKAAGLDEKLLEAWLGLGQVKLLQKDAAGAAAALGRALALDADHPEVHTALATACFALGRKSEAEEHARIAHAKARSASMNDPRGTVQSPPITATDHVNAAMQRAAGGRLDEAESLLHEALDLDPKSVTAWTNLGIVRMQRRDAEGAEKALRESLGLSPTMLAERRLAQVCLVRGRIPEAITHWEAAVKLSPDDDALKVEFASALRDVAFDELRRGKGPEGIATLKRAADVRPGFLPVQCALAFVLATHPAVDLRDGAAAVKLAEAALAVNDQNPDALDALAAAYAETGRFDEAAATVERALAIARAGGKEDAAKLFEQRRDLYRSKQPLRVAFDAKKPRKGSK